MRPDAVLLFRYSALTVNGYRPQGYPGLVVHGPLVATLLADLLRRNLPDANLSQLSFRAVRALFDTDSFFVCGQPGDDGRTVKLWARAPDGALAVEATGTLGS